MAPLLEVRDLAVDMPAAAGFSRVVHGVSFTVERGQVVGLAGESGSGKTATALAILRLLPEGARTSGSVLLDGRDVLTMTPRELRAIRGGRIGMVFQEPSTALNPVLTVGFQIADAVQAHRHLRRSAALDEAVRLLDLVAMPGARRRLGDYPHQLSGGQRQRVVLAIALAGKPDLLLADEPTTALDVTIQAQILELLESLRAGLGLAVLLITHDLGIVAERCERLLVMHDGEIVERGAVREVFAAPAHPYTRSLLAALAV